MAPRTQDDIEPGSKQATVGLFHSATDRDRLVAWLERGAAMDGLDPSGELGSSGVRPDDVGNILNDLAALLRGEQPSESRNMDQEAKTATLLALLMDVAIQAAREAKDSKPLKKRRDHLGVCSTALSLMDRNGDIPF